MNTCKFCAYWKSLKDGDDSLNWGRCFMGESRNGEPVNVDTDAFSEDEDLCAAHLTTLATFGCNQFQRLGEEKLDSMPLRKWRYEMDRLATPPNKWYTLTDPEA